MNNFQYASAYANLLNLSAKFHLSHLICIFLAVVTLSLPAADKNTITGNSSPERKYSERKILNKELLEGRKRLLKLKWRKSREMFSSR